MFKETAAASDKDFFCLEKETRERVGEIKNTFHLYGILFNSLVH